MTDFQVFQIAEENDRYEEVFEELPNILHCKLRAKFECAAESDNICVFSSCKFIEEKKPLSSVRYLFVFSCEKINPLPRSKAQYLHRYQFIVSVFLYVEYPTSWISVRK